MIDGRMAVDELRSSVAFDAGRADAMRSMYELLRTRMRVIEQMVEEHPTFAKNYRAVLQELRLICSRLDEGEL